MRTTLPLTVLASLAVFCGCARTRPYTYYTLLPVETEMPQAKAIGAKTIGVRVQRLPEYLQRPQIVRRTKDGQLLMDEYTRWAEPVESGVRRILTHQLRAVTPPETRVENIRSTLGYDPDLLIVVNIDEFIATDDGEAVASATWSVLWNGKEIDSDRGEFRERLAGEQATEMVAGYNQLIRQLAEAIVGTVTRSAKQ